MLERRLVTRETLVPLLQLEVRRDQVGLVASNAATIAQVAYEPGAEVWGLWDGDRAVGLMAMIDPQRHPWPEEGDDPQAAFLWRLMIGEEVQGQGYGRAAIGQVFAQARAWGLPRLVCSVVPDAASALPFYEKLGFRRTGRILDGEVELLADVPAA
ncbi:MAG: GNAT family N-acetyltransferase [Pseudomonadota bacterium]